VLIASLFMVAYWWAHYSEVTRLRLSRVVVAVALRR
jgi:hypothetical protein